MDWYITKDHRHLLKTSQLSLSRLLILSNSRYDMLSATIFLATVATLLDAVSAHGFVSGVITNGTWTKGSDPAWYYSSVVSRSQTAGWDSLNQDYGFIEPASFNTDNIACHKNATAAKLYANVVAGSQLTFYWNTWPESHKGPIIKYIAPCNGRLSRSIAVYQI